jgi:UPF0755 protein
MKHKLLVVFAAFASLALVAVLAMAPVIAVTDRPVSASSGEASAPVMFTVPRGASVMAIAADLHDAGLIRAERFGYLYARFRGLTLKAGTYRLSPDMRTSRILEYIDSGKQEYLKVTVPEGLTLSKTARHLEGEKVVSSDAFVAAASDPALLARYGITGATAEGYLFPDTYFFSYDMDAADIVSLMIDTFFRKIAALKSVPSNSAKLHELVILASVVEREYRLPDEAPLIASVFSNRVKIGMGLQSCATVEYIITEIQGRDHPTRLSLDDLAIRSDYNTYLWAGYPPGPICSPGLVALDAAFNPAQTKYLYFRLTDPESGSHTFTRSLDEHVEAGHHLTLKKAAGK